MKFHKNNVNQNEALDIAKKFQAKLKYPKIIFGLLAFILYAAAIQDIFTKTNFLKESEILGIAFKILLFIGIPTGLILIIVNSICPYCHEFQKVNRSKSISIDNGLEYTKGMSPFINYCSKCNAPLSENAVYEIYKDKHEHK
jgi:hypothetical protein